MSGPASDVTSLPHMADCGVGSCRPKALRRCSNIDAFTAVFGVAAMITSAMNTYIVSQITTLEKLLGIESKQSGFMLASPEIGFLAVVILTSHVTRRFHRPRLVSLLTLGFSLLVLVCTVPHFIMLQYPGLFYTIREDDLNYTKPTTNLCNLTSNTQAIVHKTSDVMLGHDIYPNTDDTSSNLRKNIQYLSFIILTISLVFQGAIKAPRIPIVSAFIDDHVPKTKTGVYFSAVVAIGIVGSLMAVGLGALSSRLYATLEPTSMSRDNPHWLGAWWLGFVVVACVSTLTTLPLAMFPRRLKTYRQTEETAAKTKSATLKSEIKDFPRAICQLLRNPVYATIIAGNCCNAVGVTGWTSYLPKYLEVHYRLEPAMATILFGASTLAGAFLGVVAGGYVISKKKMTGRTSLKYSVIVGFLALAFLLPSAFMACDQVSFNGFDLFRQKHPSTPPAHPSQVMVDTCYSNCSCNIGDYFPVCGSDNQNYFSPCFAGCQDQNFLDETFTNCTCLPVHSNQITTPGFCSRYCPTLVIFLVLDFIAAFFWLSTLIPKAVVQIRCVNVEDRSLAMGAGSFMHTCFGMLAPVVFGALIDSACILWNSGYCKLYDVADLRVKYQLVSYAMVMLSAILYAASLLVATFSERYKHILDADYDILETNAETMPGHTQQDTLDDTDTSPCITENGIPSENGISSENIRYDGDYEDLKTERDVIPKSDNVITECDVSVIPKCDVITNSDGVVTQEPMFSINSVEGNNNCDL